MSVSPDNTCKNMIHKLGLCAVCIIASLIIGGILTGLVFIFINLGVYRAYCESIIVDCNVNRTGYVYTWSPKDSAIVCSYVGEAFVEDNDWAIIDCYYDDKVNKCPSNECIEPERIKITMYIGAGLILGAVGVFIMVLIGMVIYIFVDWGIKKYCRGRNNTNNSSVSGVTANSFSTSSSDTVNSSDGKCDITVDSYSGDGSSSNDRHFYDSS